jgi:hypothetical protein
MYAGAKSVGLWIRHGWHVAIAYVIGYFALLVILGWHPNQAQRGEPVASRAPVTAPATR